MLFVNHARCDTRSDSGKFLVCSAHWSLAIRRFIFLLIVDLASSLDLGNCHLDIAEIEDIILNEGDVST